MYNMDTVKNAVQEMPVFLLLYCIDFYQLFYLESNYVVLSFNKSVHNNAIDYYICYILANNLDKPIFVCHMYT